jgi:hypothetical protein
MILRAWACGPSVPDEVQGLVAEAAGYWNDVFTKAGRHRVFVGTALGLNDWDVFVMRSYEDPGTWATVDSSIPEATKILLHNRFFNSLPIPIVQEARWLRVLIHELAHVLRGDTWHSDNRWSYLHKDPDRILPPWRYLPAAERAALLGAL